MHRAVRVLLHGEGGIGKTSFGVASPSPFFLCPESSRLPSHVPSVKPDSWADALGIIRAFQADPMDRQTFVIDTIDWLEPAVTQHVCTRDNARYHGRLMLPDGRTHAESYGYALGDVLLQEWRCFLEELDKLYIERGMNIILLAHTGAHRRRNAEGDDYDLIGPKIERKCADLVCEWPDAVLHAEFDKQLVRTADLERKNSKAKIITGGNRVCWARPRGAQRAKNRFGIPETIPLSWHEFARYALADVMELRQQIDAHLVARQDSSLTERVMAYLEQHPHEAGTMFRVLERLKTPKKEL
jgi:hypothetical protein